MRIISSDNILVLLYLQTALASECNPQDYKINVPNPYDPTSPDLGLTYSAPAYCSNYVSVPDGSWGGVTTWNSHFNESTRERSATPGGWQHDKSNWGIYQPASRGCAQFLDILKGIFGSDGCPCSVHGGSTSNAGGCGCAMRYDRHQGYCFMGTSPCRLCGRDVETGNFTYRFGCGCISCISYTGAGAKWDTAENRKALGWPSDTKCADIYNPRWYCGAGSCETCPQGNYCPPTSLRPLPCDKGFYQDTVGASVCKMCRCPSGFFVKDDREAELCDSIQGIPAHHCRECNQCADAGTSKFCPGIRDPSYGYWQQEDANGKKCRKCKLCSGLEYALFPPLGERQGHFCVTDDPQITCAERYSEVKCEFGASAACRPLSGKMPWRSGFRRVPGRQYTPGSIQTADLGFLPYFEACPALRTGRKWRTMNLHDADWSRDCEPQECAVGFYATLADDKTTVSSCTPCQPGSSGGGGVVTECLCNTGLASFSVLKRAYPMTYLPTARAAIDCINCMRDVYFVNGNNNQQEAVACRNGSVTRASGAQYVFDKNGSIGLCRTSVAGKVSVSLPNRTGCTTCPPGTFTGSDGTCTPCNEGQYQDEDGQTSCKSKRTRCAPGYVMMSNSVDKDNRLKDYACNACPTECPEMQITVRAPNMSTEACDGNGKSFFACYNGWGDGSGPHAPPGYRLQYTGEGSATMHSCGASPPRYAAWVGFENAGAAGAECYFACIHGVNVSARGIYNAALNTHVRRSRRELIPYLVKPTTSTSPFPSKVMLDTVWQYEEIGSELPPDLSWTMPLEWDVKKNVADASTNTFLFVDAVDASAVCMHPETSYTTACPRGYRVNNVDHYKDDVEGCALIARTSLLMISRNGLVSYAAVSSSMQCITESPSELSTFQNRNRKCGPSCLNTRVAAANTALRYELVPSDPWATRLLWMTILLQPRYWLANGLIFNPYIPIDDNACNATKCAYGTFEWSTDNIADAFGKRRGHTSCVPCSVGPHICSLLTPPQYFRGCLAEHQNTIDVVKHQTVRELCIECRFTHEDGASLIDMTHADYGTWFTMRNILDYQNADAWRNVQCRYYCPTGYTSNVDPEMYKTRPCLPCAHVTQIRCRGVDEPSFVYGTTTMCGGMRNFIPYMPQCASCSANDIHGLYDFVGVGVADGYAKCVGMCKPSMYHSMRLPTIELPEYVLVTEPVAIGSIECTPCSTMQNVACGGRCSKGHYRNGSNCLPCSTEKCPHGYYRELCPATSDAICMPCPSYPPTSEGVLIAPNATKHIMKHVNSMHAHECPLRCANNYAWINITSGLSPFRHTNDTLVFEAGVFACVTCASMSTIPLYSFWNDDCVSNPNAIPATSSVALQSMQHVSGGCCLCQLYHDVVFSSNALCELRAGFTTQSQGVASSVSIVLSMIPPALNLNSWRTRRLLSVSSVDSISVNAYRQPVLSNMDYFAVCDEKVSVEEKRKCVSMRGKVWELSKTQGVIARRSDAGACVAGTYKPGRGAASPCYACPDGSSTTGPYYEGATECVCMPGYALADNACIACSVGTHRPSNSPNMCIPCPDLSETVGTGSAYCYCVSGAYNSYDGSCVMCEPGFYCESGTRHQCPQNSVSATGAKSREECVCGPDYYYGQVSQECIFKDSTRNSLGKCIAGWSATANGGCSSGCPPGTFLAPDFQQASMQQKCTPCPPGTFSSTGNMVGQCMPCPPNKQNGSTTCNPAAVKEECASGQYYDFASCRDCPLGTVSPPNSIGISSCRCPPGFFIASTECVPCPRGMFSSTISSTCSKCPPNFTTETTGATSLLECRRSVTP